MAKARASVALVDLLRSVELFDGLTDQQFETLASVFDERAYKRNEMVFEQGDEGDRLYVVRRGFVEVVVDDEQGQEGPRTLINLGRGQVFGEMALVDRGKRSATVRSVDDGTTVNSISHEAFTNLCQKDTAIGYTVMRNIAADLSFKLRLRNLPEQS
jgi:CRP-like cAMP-binding protein